MDIEYYYKNRNSYGLKKNLDVKSLLLSFKKSKYA